MPHRKFQLSYADQLGTHRYFRPGSKADALRRAAKLINKTEVAQIVIRQDLEHLKSNLPRP